MGGAILTSDMDFFDDQLTPFFRHTGPTLSPFNAWVMVKGLETLDVRIARHCENALAVAEFLSKQKGINKVLYPGLESHPQFELAMTQMSSGGTMVSFEVDGGKEAAFNFLNSLRLIDISNNLGDAKSLTTHPATTTHQRLTPEERHVIGISDGLVRLSVGLEDVDDLKEDLDQGLGQAKA